MLATATATEYVRPMDSGRTCPVIVNCERTDGSIVTTVAKFSDYCDQKEVHLAREIVAACLAGDLGLPIPTPVLIEVPPGWADIAPDPDRRARIRASGSFAFGSVLVTGGYPRRTDSPLLCRDSGLALRSGWWLLQMENAP